MLPTERHHRRRHLRHATWPAAVYAIGDVHGCDREFAELERQIVADSAALPGQKWMVTLGDHVDRGPDSRGAIDRVLSPPPQDFRRLALVGNHEQLMLDFLADPEANAFWLDEGGAETLASYGVDILHPFADGRVLDAFIAQLAATLPKAHLEWMVGLPSLLELPGWIFVHAGIRPGVPLEDQDDHDLMWIRRDFLDGPGLPGYRIVHGHTPVGEPEITPERIDIDTRCYGTGRLTALRVTPDGDTRLFST